MAELDDPAAPLPDPADADAWAERFDLLADPTRLGLLAHMHLHPGATVGELAAAVGVSADTASQALRGLRERGCVVARPDGRRRRYELTDEVAHAVLHWLGHHH